MSQSVLRSVDDQVRRFTLSFHLLTIGTTHSSDPPDDDGEETEFIRFRGGSEKGATR
jgi:hypothetical protein